MGNEVCVRCGSTLHDGKCTVCVDREKYDRLLSTLRELLREYKIDNS
jgi:hypothetical protein